MIKRDIIDNLDCVLARHGRHRRIDVAEMPEGPLKALTAPCEQRAKQVVKLVNCCVQIDYKQSVYIFFCEDESYGAYTFHDKYTYIVLNIGVILRLSHFCDRMMMHPELWPDIPAYSFEAFAVALTFECFDLIVRHELAHIMLQHLSFGGSDIPNSPGISQVLEFFADGHAAWWGYQNLKRVSEVASKRQNRAAGGFLAFNRTRSASLHNYLMSLYFGFRIMDEDIPRFDQMTSATHPPASFRFNVMSIHLGKHFELIGDTEAHDLLVCADTWERGENIFAALLDRQPNRELKKWTLSNESERYYNQLSELARTLPPHLSSLAYEGW